MSTLKLRDLTPSEKKLITSYVAGCRDKVIFWAVVNKLEQAKKGGKKKVKGEAILVVGKHRIYAFRPGAKSAQHAHLLDILEVSSATQNEFELQLRGSDKPVLGETNRVDEMISTLLQSFRKNFPEMDPSLGFGVNVWPKERMDEILKFESSEVGKCGGFTKTYKSICNYLGSPYRVDVCWDVNNLLWSNKVKRFDVSEFGFDNVVDFRPCMAALRYNKWYGSLPSFVAIRNSQKVCITRLLDNIPEGVMSIGDMIKFNTSLEQLIISNVNGINKDTFSFFCESLILNRANNVRYLDVSNNIIEDKGFILLAKWVSETPNPLVVLDLSNCSGSTKGIVAMSEALQANIKLHASLKKLNLSQNKFEQDSSFALGQALRDFTGLKVLGLSATGSLKLDPILGALKKSNTIQELDLSNNKLNFSIKGGQHTEMQAVLGFLKACTTLKNLNLARTTIPADSLSELISNAPQLQKLDVSENELFDKGLIQLFEALKSHKSLKHLIIDRNFKPGKSKNREQAVASLVNLINSAECTIKLESLSVAGSIKYAIKNDIVPFLQALSINDTLTELDVSGNEFGDLGLLCIAKTIQQNRKLRSLKFDENGITVSGLKSFNVGLSRNTSLMDVPLPLSDVNHLMKDETVQAPLRAILNHIQSRLNLNRSNYAAAHPSPLSNMSEKQRDEISQLLKKVDDISSMSENEDRSLQDMEDQIKDLVGEEWLASVMWQATSNSASFAFDKLLEQLDAIVVLSSVGEAKKNTLEKSASPPAPVTDQPAAAQTPTKAKQTPSSASLLPPVTPEAKPKEQEKEIASPNTPAPSTNELSSEKYVDTKSRAMNAKLRNMLRHVEKEDAKSSSSLQVNENVPWQRKDLLLSPVTKQTYRSFLLTENEEDDEVPPPPPEEEGEIPPPPEEEDQKPSDTNANDHQTKKISELDLLSKMSAEDLLKQLSAELDSKQ